LRARFGVSVRLENDADTAALGEYRFGAGRNSEPAVMLTFGTGIGFAAIVRGQIYRGVDGSHPELGHIATAIQGPRCYCGIDGCFESLASGTAMEAAGREAGFANSREVFDAAKNGHVAASRVVDRALQATASAAWNIAHSFVPERMILGGGIMEDHFALFAQAIESSLARAVMIPRSKVQVVPASLGARAGVVGAACLAMHPS
jgi:glucokinase